MTSSEKQKLYKTSVSVGKNATLKIHPKKARNYSLVPRQIQVIDSHFARVAEGFDNLEEKLAPGVYTVRVESTHDPFEQTLLLRPNATEVIAYPVSTAELLVSPAPVLGSTSMREFLREPLEELTELPSPRGSARFVFMSTRREDRGSPTKIDLDGFGLWSDKGERVIDFSVSARFEAQHHRWAAVSADLSPGGYLLCSVAQSFGRRENVWQPIWLQCDWTILLFTEVEPGAHTPSYREMSIHMTPVQRSFAPGKLNRSRKHGRYSTRLVKEQIAVECALASLASGRLLMPIEDIRRSLLVGKFDNPMLGLLGAHLLLKDPSSPRRLIAKVLRNLVQLLPGHPDVNALLVMGLDVGVNILPPAIEWPTMLLDGYVACRRADWADVRSVVPGSLADRVRSSVIPGGVWTRWTEDEHVKGLQLPVRDPLNKRGWVPPVYWSTRFSSRGPNYRRRFEPDRERGEAQRGSVPLTSRGWEHLVKFVNESQSKLRRPLVAEDLKWTGLNYVQAQFVLDALGVPKLGREGLVRLVRSVKDRLGGKSSKANAETAIEAVVAAIKKGVTQDKVVRLSGFGTFKLVERKTSKGVNPKTGQKKAAKAKVIEFVPSKHFKSKL